MRCHRWSSLRFMVKPKQTRSSQMWPSFRHENLFSRNGDSCTAGAEDNTKSYLYESTYWLWSIYIVHNLHACGITMANAILCILTCRINSQGHFFVSCLKKIWGPINIPKRDDPVHKFFVLVFNKDVWRKPKICWPDCLRFKKTTSENTLSEPR